MHGEAFGWGWTEELLAATVDRLGQLAYLYGKVHFQGPHPQPEQVPRPGERAERLELEEPPQMSTPAEIKAFFGTDAIVVTDS